MVCPTRKRVGKSMPGEAIVLKSSLGFLRSDLFIREGQLKIKLFKRLQYFLLMDLLLNMS